MNKDPYWLFRIISKVRQVDVANQTHIPASRISLIENQLATPRPDEMEKLARALGMRPKDIWGSSSSAGEATPEVNPHG